MAQPFVFMSEQKRQDFENAFAHLLQVGRSGTNLQKKIFQGREFFQITTYTVISMFSLSCPLWIGLSGVSPVLCDWVFIYFQKGFFVLVKPTLDPPSWVTSRYEYHRKNFSRRET